MWRELGRYDKLAYFLLKELKDVVYQSKKGSRYDTLLHCVERSNSYLSTFPVPEVISFF
nr:hypothetical protein Itr_chr09CG20590 [Ipomoea trifida]